jgi:hypothetical protein
MISAKRTLALLCLAFLTGCGSPGAPLPPSLELARPVSDLRATRKGSAVTLTWTAPAKTTDGHNIRHFGSTEICRAYGPIEQCGTPLARVPGPKSGAAAQQHDGEAETYRDTLSNFSSSPEAKFVYAVEILNSYGRSAGLSNEVEIPDVPTLAPPSDLRAQLNSDGVHLLWSAPASVPDVRGLSFLYRIYRREASANAQVIAGELPVQAGPEASFLDNSFEWEKSYQYRVTVVTLIAEPSGPAQIEGDDSPEVTVFAHDVFPPAVPSGLQAVFSGPGQKPFIDLVWAPDTGADLAGYNVFRSEAGAEPKKLNDGLVKSPAFRDVDVLPGHEYTYSVSALDVRGNESSRSEAAQEKVPEQ